jgi:hypothetical protein
LPRQLARRPFGRLDVLCELSVTPVVSPVALAPGKSGKRK